MNCPDSVLWRIAATLKVVADAHESRNRTRVQRIVLMLAQVAVAGAHSTVLGTYKEDAEEVLGALQDMGFRSVLLPGSDSTNVSIKVNWD